jgi:hypothetical protein
MSLDQLMDWYLRRIATLDSLEYACHWEKDYLQTNVDSGRERSRPLPLPEMP